MSLATRCAACGTVFRVVQDQLRVSAGWVRCGRCGEVFNAIESLVDLELDRPGEGSIPSVQGSRVMDDLAKVAGARPPVARSLGEAAPAQTSEAAVRPSVGEPAAGQASDDRPHLDTGVKASAAGADLVSGPSDHAGLLQGFMGPANSESETDLPSDHSNESDFLSTSVAATPASEPRPQEGGTEAPWVSSSSPTFVRNADRAARWRSPTARLLLSASCLLALAALLWQIHQSHHDWIAARWPALRPAIERVCAVSGCEVVAPRQIESLVVDSSGLVRDGTLDTYRLTLVLRNRSRWTLRLPAIDLVMTDAQGGVVARRVLDAQATGVRADFITGESDLALATRLRVQGPSIVGYTIELFYP